MKMLVSQFAFVLPDDFEGDFNDALREVIKYRESKDLPGIPKGSLEISSETAGALDETWGHLCDTVLETYKEGSHFHGYIFCGQYFDDEKGQRWERWPWKDKINS